MKIILNCYDVKIIHISYLSEKYNKNIPIDACEILLYHLTGNIYVLRILFFVKMKNNKFE